MGSGRPRRRRLREGVPSLVVVTALVAVVVALPFGHAAVAAPGDVAVPAAHVAGTDATAASTASSVATSDAPVPAVAASDDVANVTVYRTSDAVPGSAAGVDAAIANGTIRPAETVVLGETLVVVVDSERLARAMAAGSGSTTARFFDALDGGATFRVLQTNPTASRNRKVAPVGPENATVYRDGARTYVLVRTGDLDVRYRVVDRPTRSYGRERFAVEFGADLPESPSPGTEGSSRAVRFVPAASEFEPDAGYDPIPPDRVALSVHVHVEPDESLVARLRLDGGRTIAAPVNATGTTGVRTVRLDLSGVDAGTGYVLELVHDDLVVDWRAGVVRKPRARLANVTLTRTGNGTAVVVTATLSHGGAVAVLDEHCEQVGLASVDAGVERRLAIELRSDDGTRVRADSGDYGVLLRARSASTAARAVYGAEATVDFDGSCRTPTPRFPPTPVSTSTPADATAGTAPQPHATAVATTPTGATVDASAADASSTSVGTSDGARSDERDGRGPDGSGLPSITAATVVAALLVAALVGVRSR